MSLGNEGTVTSAPPLVQRIADGPTPPDKSSSSSSRQNPRVSVVLSFWNEEAIIPELIRRLRDVLIPLRKSGQIASHELIFVNDASTDRSELVIRDAAAGHDDIRLVNMSRNFGVSPCVVAGMAHASGDVVIYMDADLQDPPEVIPRMIEAYRSEPDIDVVHTVRTKRHGETWIKLLITKAGYAILKRVATIDLPVEAGDFKLLSRRVVDHLVNMREKRPFVRALVCWIGFKQKKIEYQREARFSGKTKFPILGLGVIRNFLDSAFISFSDVPLRLAMIAGAMTSVLTLLFIFWILLEKIRGHNLPGWTATMVAILFLGGVQLLCIGLQGLYISSIFVETKWRPNYIVRDTFGFSPSAMPPGPQASQQTSEQRAV
jgi:glycosyltransferase involved in cell wall biosynthesis